MTLSWGSKLVKYLLFTFNLLFLISGIVLLSVGVTIKAYFNDFETFLDHQYFSVANLLIAVGVIIFFIAFFGCCGAIRESYCMILTFSCLMIIIFILELSAGIAGYVLRDQTAVLLRNELNASMTRYRNDDYNEITRTWDVIQSQFECCGVDSPSDWKTLSNTNYSIPMSCCAHKVGSVGNYRCDMNNTLLFHTGCLTAFGEFIENHAVTIGGVGIGFAIVQLMGIIFSCHLARRIRDY